MNLIYELLEITRLRIATLEGCPEECIKWNNQEVPYDEQESFFERKLTLKSAFPNIKLDFTIYYELVEKDLDYENEEIDPEEKELIEAVHKVFPFASITHIQ